MVRFLILLVLSSPACAAPLPRAEYAFQALNVIDAAQTIDCLDRHVCHEGNPIIGHDPSKATLIGVKIGTGAVHYLITRWLMRDYPRIVRAWEIASITVQGGIVAANLRFAF